MKTTATELTYAGGSLKYPKDVGVPGVLALDSQEGCLTLSGVELPLVPTGEFTAEPDGTFVRRGDRLLVALGNLWFTPNVVILVVTENPGEGQQAVFTF